MKEFIHKHIISFCIVLFILSTPVLWYILDIPLNNLEVNYQYSLAIKNMATAVFAIILMGIVWGKGLFSFKGNHFFKSLFTFGLVGVIGSLGAFAFNLGEIDLKPTAFTIIGYLLMNLSIAFSEEVLFRGIMMNLMKKVWRGQEKVILKAVLASSLLFGLKHINNLLTYPNQIVTTGAQILFAGMAGMYLAAVYIRSQNIWVCIFIHFLEDTAVTIMELFSSQTLNNSVADIGIMQASMMILIQIPYVIVCLLMLRDKRALREVL
jgi:membrane protease YdiL (CAAX protease family)